MRALLTVASLLLAASASLPAQIVTVYGTFSSLHASDVESGQLHYRQDNPAPTALTSSFWAPGFGGGVTLRLLPLGPVALGLDLRGSSKPGTTGADTGLAGLKLSVQPPFVHLKLYVQGSGGYLRTRTVNITSYQQDPPGPPPQPYTNQYAVYEILGGIDRPILRILDLRLIEVGGGKAYPINLSSLTNDNPNAMPNNTNPSVFTLSTGLVFHF